MSTLRVETHVPPWRKRRELLEPMIDDSMCRIRDGAASDPRSRSLALVRPAEVIGFRLEPHPGWTRDEQAKIDAYVNQLEFDVFSDAQDKTPPQPPMVVGNDNVFQNSESFSGSHNWRAQAKTSMDLVFDDAIASQCLEIRYRAKDGGRFQANAWLPVPCLEGREEAAKLLQQPCGFGAARPRQRLARRQRAQPAHCPDEGALCGSAGALC